MPGPRARGAEEALQATERAAAARERRLRELVAVDEDQLRQTVRASDVDQLREQLAQAAERFRCTCSECVEYERLARQMGTAQAERRAKQLLLSWLDEAQARSYRNGDGFVVRGRSGTSYRVWEAYEAPTFVLDGPYAGSEVCVQLPVNYHPADAALARKLLIETDEEAFLSVANGLRLAPPPRPQIQMSQPRVEVLRNEGSQIVYRVVLDVDRVTVDRVVERE